MYYLVGKLEKAKDTEKAQQKMAAHIENYKACNLDDEMSKGIIKNCED